MRYAIGLLLCLLVGCGQQQSDTSDTSSTPVTFDYIGTTGTRVVYDPDVTRNDPALYENAFIDTRQCMFDNGYMDTTDIRGTIVHVVNHEPSPGIQGTFDPNTGVITIVLDGPIRHEMTHYILSAIGFDRLKNHNHEHAAFERCAESRRSR